jgi:hypothetical protein
MLFKNEINLYVLGRFLDSVFTFLSMDWPHYVQNLSAVSGTHYYRHFV